MRWRSIWRQAWHFDPPPMLAAQMGLVQRNAMGALWATMLVSLLSAWAFDRLMGMRQVWDWAFVTCVICLVSARALGALPDPSEPARAERFAQGVGLIALATGACWGALGVLFIRLEQPLTLSVVMGVEGGVNAGALAVFGAAWPLALRFWLVSLLPMAVTLLASGSELGAVFSGAVCIFFGAMVLFGYHAAQVARRMIELSFDNRALVARLRDQTQRALDARQDAELAQAEAERADRAKTVFLASASHDLRQPLHAMGLFLSALGRSGLDERQAALLDQAQASSHAAGDMLATLLDFSKVDAGVIRPRPQAFALQTMFQRLEQELAPQAEAKGLVFRVRDTGEVVHADPALVDMAVRNLLTNAVRYTDRGGVLLACRRRGARVVIEVWDTGIGIPADQHSAIFQEFLQLGNPERDRRKGLGLGLAIVAGLARAMSVDVAVSSRPGRGSVFRLSLPASSQGCQPAEVAGAEEPGLDGLKVLLIDDDPSVCAAMSDLLASWGCWCRTVPSGEAASQVASAFEPDVVLTDYRLRSHRTGLDALAQVRAALGRAVPAAIITGDTGPERMREADASGLQLLHKPVPAERLQSVLLSLWREVELRARDASASAAG